MTAGSSADWVRQGPYAWDGPGGTRISSSAGKARGGDAVRWVFSAWGAEECPWLNTWQWRKQVGQPERYGLSDAPRTRRVWLGNFESAEAARAACLASLAGSGAIAGAEGGEDRGDSGGGAVGASGAEDGGAGR